MEIEVSQKKNILQQALEFHFFDMPREILKGWKNFLKFNLNYFSIPLLLKTFFYYWRGYKWSYGRGFDLTRYLEAFTSNMVFRILGAFLRTWLIIFGIITEISLFFIGLLSFLIWIFLPIILISGFFYGLKLLF
jgi:hypothetical protein